MGAAAAAGRAAAGAFSAWWRDTGPILCWTSADPAPTTAAQQMTAATFVAVPVATPPAMTVPVAAPPAPAPAPAAEPAPPIPRSLAIVASGPAPGVKAPKPRRVARSAAW